MIRNLNIFDASTTAIQQLTADFFAQAWDMLHLLYTKAVASEMFSGDSKDQIDHAEDLMFLFSYLVLLDWEKRDILEMTGMNSTRQYLYEGYDIAKVRQYFAHTYVDIDPLLTVFDIEIANGTFNQ